MIVRKIILKSSKYKIKRQSDYLLYLPYLLHLKLLQMHTHFSLLHINIYIAHIIILTFVQFSNRPLQINFMLMLINIQLTQINFLNSQVKLSFMQIKFQLMQVNILLVQVRFSIMKSIISIV